MAINVAISEYLVISLSKSISSKSLTGLSGCKGRADQIVCPAASYVVSLLLVCLIGICLTSSHHIFTGTGLISNNKYFVFFFWPAYEELRDREVAFWTANLWFHCKLDLVPGWGLCLEHVSSFCLIA